jgi:membrane-associated protease RseP (regulator of RpoE activity)
MQDEAPHIPAEAPTRQAGRLSVKRGWLHGGLFVATLASTFFVGLMMSTNVWQAVGYSSAIVAILLVHEMGHFAACRRHRVAATLPYFIPVPLPPFGTMGAVIRMRGEMRSRASVFDIGVAGPLAGLVIAIPVTIWGIALSSVTTVPQTGTEGWRLGDSLLFSLLARLTIGDVPAGSDLLLHPIGMAGWAGLFVTGLNLLPVGQLDGGHILYALLGRRARWIGLAFIAFLAALTVFYHRAWWPFLALLFFFGPGHPHVSGGQMNRARLALGWVMIALMVATFIPRPIVVAGP